MPELPEVEVLRRSLEPQLVGRRIEDVDVRCSALREPVRPAMLRRRCMGRAITTVGRRAKYLLIGLEDAAALVVHLGMSGRLTVGPASEEAERHQHVTFGIGRGERLRYTDPRRFGLVLVRSTRRLASDRHFAHLGVEPLDGAFDGEVLCQAARRRRGPVKSFLMDGRVVVGVGNIYASEALFRCGIHPRRGVGRISSERWDRLAAAVAEVLAQAIEQGGTTLNDFADGNGNPGYFQVALAVYGQEGRPCPRCGREIRRILQAGRSTYYCPGCQR